jgi:MFS family permease
VRWYESIGREQWKALAAAQLGWMLDATDVMLYAFALTSIQVEFRLSSGTAGLLMTATLVSSSAGGILSGWLSDRYGRVRMLTYSILAYSVFTAMTATASSAGALLMWRALVGLGLGGEWSAGSVLVAEAFPAEHRGKVIGIMQSGWAIGYIFAALLAATILPVYGWRPLFVVGLFPALVAAWVRRSVPEPEIWKTSRSAAQRTTTRSVSIFRPPLVRNTVVAMLLATAVLFAYWGLFSWLPAYLATPLARGGAGLSLVRSSAWIIAVQAGAFLGYTLFGYFSDRFGRRPSFVAFVLGAAVLTPLYGLGGRYPVALMLMGPLVGFFGHGYFSVFGALLAELFPSAVRGMAQGLCYNVGRAAGGLAPLVIGRLADLYGIGPALAVTSLFFLAAAGLMWLLPETRGEKLA